MSYRFMEHCERVLNALALLRDGLALESMEEGVRIAETMFIPIEGQCVSAEAFIYATCLLNVYAITTALEELERRALERDGVKSA